MSRGKEKIPPAVAGMMGADGGGWNLIKRPRDEKDVERALEVIKTLQASRDPLDQKALKNLTAMRQTVRERQASIQVYLAAIAEHPAFQDKFAEWAIDNPGDFMKIMAQVLPKDANIEVHNTQERILKVELKPMNEWLKTIEDATEEPNV